MKDRQSLVRELQKYNRGAAVITREQFAKFMGTTNNSKMVHKFLELEAIDGRFRLVTDVADMLIRNLR